MDGLELFAVSFEEKQREFASAYFLIGQCFNSIQFGIRYSKIRFIVAYLYLEVRLCSEK